MLLALMATLVLGSGLIGTLLTIAIIGVIFYLIDAYIPMAPPIKTVFRIIAVVIAIVYLLRLIGVSL